MTQSFIELCRVSRSFHEGGAELCVLRAVSLEICKGEKIALLGRSGSGKSTLLNLISGIDLPDSGSVVLGGQDLTRMSEHERTLFRRRNVGFIYQSFNLVPGLTAFENIEFIMALNGFDKKMSRSKTMNMLEKLGLESRRDAFPEHLSGGEQQRVAIARALVHEPALVLADEPTGNLDAENGRRILAILQQMLSEQGSNLLLVTHSLEVAKTADRILTLEDGVLQERHGDFAW